MRKVLLIGWDSADWKLINPLLDRGEMPHLARFLENGVMGDLMTLEPVLSPMLWNSIATGKYADQHGILGFTEVNPDNGRVQPVTSTSRRCKALWNMLHQRGLSASVVNWFGGHPAEPLRGVCVSDTIARSFPAPGDDWPFVPGSVHPSELADTIAGLRMRPDEVDDQLLTLFVPRAAEVDQDRDVRLEGLAKLLAEAFTVQSVGTWVMQNRPWDFLGIYYPSLDHFGHLFANFHPPKPQWIDERQFELYKDVFSGAYRLHDLMLGGLLAQVPDETTVVIVSDHGFHSDHMRPEHIPQVTAGPTQQHRKIGVFAMKGPGIRKDERLYSLGLLDIAPTVLTMFGLPVGRDMPGRVIAEAFEEPPVVTWIPSWEEEPGDAGQHTQRQAMSAADADALLDQFVALGYIERPDDDAGKAADHCRFDQEWNLAQVYTSTHRPHLALPLLEDLHERKPDRNDVTLALAGCQALIGLREQARTTAIAAINTFQSHPSAHLMLAQLDFMANKPSEGLERLALLERAIPDSSDMSLALARCYVAARRWEDAERHTRRALEFDGDNAEAHEVLARLMIHSRRYPEAAGAALEAVGRRFDSANAHFLLGVALYRMDRADRAVPALETALRLQPPARAAHRLLARCYLVMADRQDDALRQRDAWRAVRVQAAARRDTLAHLREQAMGREQARAKRRAAAGPAPTAVTPPEPPRSCEFIVVSGLPRSGTSLMMQMLAAAGIPVATDGERNADEDNPRGYLEWEAIKQVGKKPELLYEVEGKALKVISMLLPALPLHHKYKVIFMDRPVEEVAASQAKMIERRGKEAPAIGLERMKAKLSSHRQVVVRGLKMHRSFQVLVVSYPDLVRNPELWIGKIGEFLGIGSAAEAMRDAIDPALHRNWAG